MTLGCSIQGLSNKNNLPKKHDDTYYKNAIGKTGMDLKRELNSIISKQEKLPYKYIWSALRDTDEDLNNADNVILLYTERSQDKFSNGSNNNDWNREHVWPQSHGKFGTTKGPGTDLHHIRAADVSVNSSRGNLDFDNGGKMHTEATNSQFDNDSWEPPDSVKGDIARMLFYMSVRYEGENNEPDLELNDSVNNNSTPYMGKLSVLLKWHQQDPVDSFERKRNNIIFNKYQHNRNPFIDRPEWVNEIWR
ncbi:endonuclease (plasmid) [Bacillus cereus]|uniref:Extracellular ribonuclease n=1 Tax=Bacillus cereus (strain 03BB102) TaxID=572264 RepID=A0A125Y9R4_BACC3|nr:endonuclease [Bacillus cereus]ACO25654.1 extracellular ribonuclease [Bacillus cereus 03BB102]AJG51201.1 endonuclease I family protein [Bacillus cereus 03BB102]QPR80807.1 endonuclease [Bacillus cereus]